MEELRAEDRFARSVWSVAAVAVLVFVCLALFAGLFDGSEISAIPSAK